LALEFIQKTFKETCAKTCRSKHNIGGDFYLGKIPFMAEIFGTGGVFAFVELEEEVHPVVYSVQDLFSVE